MAKSYNKIMTVLFCAFLGGLLIFHLILPDRERSQTENRLLAQAPEVSAGGILDGSFMEDVEAYFQDQFPLRDGFTGLKARVSWLLGQREFNNVYLCGDRLISKVDKPTDLAQKNLQYVNTLAEKTDIPVYLGLIPSAAEVYGSDLPYGAASFDEAAYIGSAADVGDGTIDMIGALSSHTGEYIYYRTDHHWTTRGAYYGYKAIMEALGRSAEDISSFSHDTASSDFNGTLYSQSGVHWLEPDAIEFWVTEDGLSVYSWGANGLEKSALYDRSYLSQKDKYSAFLGGNQPLCVIKNESGSGKILLIRDSYSDALAPFLGTSFEEVHLFDLRYNRMSAAQYAHDNGIDTIIVLMSVSEFIASPDIALLTQ